MFRTLAPLLPFTVLACAALDDAAAPAPGGPEEEPVAAEPAAEPPPEPAADPELSLEERWLAPFAVEVRGALPTRTARAQDPDPAGEWEVVEAAPFLTEVPRPEPDDTVGLTHRVEEGETFWGIAQRYELPLDVLADANLHLDPGRIQPGDLLRIPGAEPSPVDPAADPEPEAAPRLHRVVAGETLWGISRRYGVSMDSIRAANDMDGFAVRAGEVLVIPEADPDR